MRRRRHKRGLGFTKAEHRVRGEDHAIRSREIAEKVIRLSEEGKCEPAYDLFNQMTLFQGRELAERDAAGTRELHREGRTATTYRTFKSNCVRR